MANKIFMNHKLLIRNFISMNYKSNSVMEIDLEEICVLDYGVKLCTNLYQITKKERDKRLQP